MGLALVAVRVTNCAIIIRATTASSRREYHCHTLASRAVERARQDELVVLRFTTNYSPTLFYDLRLLVLLEFTIGRFVVRTTVITQTLTRVYSFLITRPWKTG